jgi:hypothetical protein
MVAASWKQPHMPRHPDATIRRAIRVLSMVGELHKRGYQRLRAMPYMSPSGAYWRCVIGPVDDFCRNHGAILAGGESSETANYSSGQENEYFGWIDAGKDDARSLADKFVGRFDRLAERGRGWDYPYAGWYVHLLGLAETGWLPFVLSDNVETRFNCVPLAASQEGLWHPCPIMAVSERAG